MNMKKSIMQTVAVGGALALALTLFAQRPVRRNSAPDRTSQSDTFEEIDAHIERQIDRLNVPGAALAIVDDDEIVHLRGFGQTRPGGEAPAPRTPFFIGSLTKSFTALAVMQLVEAGKIDLDAPVQRYLPWFRVADPQVSAQITVRHLLNQTSGLPTSSGEIQLADFDDRPDATERQARALSTLVLTRPVGSAFEYSNSNYNLLGLIIEPASGESYADYVQKHIFIPLDMSHAYTSQALAKQSGLAVGHQYWFTIPFAAPNMPIPHGSLPGGLLISNAEDMARYLIAHLNGGRYGDVQILSGAGIEELHRGVAEFRTMGISVGKYGMGWFDSVLGQTKLLWHTGVLPHFFAYMALLPEQKKGVVLLFNASHHWMSPVLTDFGTGVAALLAGEQPAPSRFGFIPWALRGQLLIPALQIAGVVATLRLLRRWRLDPERRPSGGRKWGLHILLPLIPNLLVTLTLLPMLGKRRGYLMLYMPDYSWIAMACGSFSLVWIFLRTGLVLRTLRKPHRRDP
jgi:CubicO group peptidase (beta-lactamase class C family)